MKSKKAESSADSERPQAGVVCWIATLRPGRKSPRTSKRSIKVEHRSWFYARQEATRIFGVGPEDLDVEAKESRDGKKSDKKG